MQGSNGVLASFPADPPTTTMQRVKALLTGSLPTFLDVSSVFAGGEIREDNVLLQAMRSGMRVGAVGDDTWTQLFPPSSHASLNLSHPYPSLNVHDLDTVDDGVAAVRPPPDQPSSRLCGCPELYCHLVMLPVPTGSASMPILLA